MTITADIDATATNTLPDTIVTIEDFAGILALPEGVRFAPADDIEEVFVAVEGGYKYDQPGAMCVWGEQDAKDDGDVPAIILNPEVLGEFRTASRNGVKVGDRVIVKAATYASGLVGSEGTVLDIDKGWTPGNGDPTHEFYVDTEKGGTCYASEVEKIAAPVVDNEADYHGTLRNPLVSRDFKMGDEVVISDRAEYKSFVGLRCRVTEARSSYTKDGSTWLTPLTERPDNHGLSSFWWDTDDLDAVEEHPFKVGDRLRAVNFSSIYENGDEVTVTRTFFSGTKARVATTRDSDGRVCGDAYVSRFEKIEEPAFEEYDAWMTTDQFVGAFAKGQKVRVVALHEGAYAVRVVGESGAGLCLYADEFSAEPPFPFAVGDRVTLPTWSIGSKGTVVWVEPEKDSVEVLSDGGAYSPGCAVHTSVGAGTFSATSLTPLAPEDDFPVFEAWTTVDSLGPKGEVVTVIGPGRFGFDFEVRDESGETFGMNADEVTTEEPKPEPVAPREGDVVTDREALDALPDHTVIVAKRGYYPYVKVCGEFRRFNHSSGAVSSSSPLSGIEYTIKSLPN